MVITGTREAFIALISERGVYKRLGVKVSTVSTWKIYLREGKSISLDKMEEMLLKAGAVVVQEKVWEVKTKVMKNNSYEDIPKIGITSITSLWDMQEFIDILSRPIDQDSPIINNPIFKKSGEVLDEFCKALDIEFKKVYDHAIATGIIKGKPTKDKFDKAGYDMCTHKGVGTYIRRNGERVSKIVKIGEVK